ncbi:hypothetical protein C6497_14595 [Candidatus Poribacteria bacterium]|nr:MAG: hypothetical protein C6497_14595 [Candidatus Poribacteria bacterium]
MKLLVYLSVLFLFIGGLHTASAAVKDDGLILYFSFDKESGGKIIDETGSGNDATIVADAKIVTDDVVHGKGALLCDSNTSSVTVDSFNELEDYQDNTFLFWVNFTKANSGGWDQIIAKKAPGSDRSPGIWTCSRIPLHIHWRFNPGNQGPHCAGPTGEDSVFEIGEWYHIAGSKKGSQISFYVNGKRTQQNNVPADHAQGNERLYIGRTGYNSAKFILDDLYVYDRALDEGEVASVMDGDLLPVQPQAKLTTTWGQVKTSRD